LRADNGYEALAAALARRKAGERVRIVVALEHPAVTRAIAMWRELDSFAGDRDEKLAEIAVIRARAPDPLSEQLRELYRTTLALADDAICASWLHVHGIEAMLGGRIRNVRITVPALVHTVERQSTGDTYVAVIVSEDEPEARAYAAFALGDLHAPVRFFTTDRIGECTNAALLVDAHWKEPDAAVAAVATGLPVVVSLTSGAREFMRPAGAYNPLIPESLADIVRRALGASASRPCATISAHSVSTADEERPHVTFLVRTKNRPQLLGRTLDSVAQQSDAIVDAIVVNDGGERVDDIVAAYPFAILIHRDESEFTSAASAALARATGTYVQLLDDDDALFPHHAALAGRALDRSGANIAYTDSLNVYLDDAQPPRIAGYRALLEDRVDRDRMLVANPIVGSVRVMYRRSALVSSGGFRPLPIAEDYDATLRLSRASDVVHVASTTAIYGIFADARNLTVANAGHLRASLEQIYATVPVRGRPLIEGRRAEQLEKLADFAGTILRGAAVTLPTPAPL
jgi:hypothetical protein